MRCVRVALLLFLITRCAAVAAPPLERSTPEAQGVSSSAILGFLDAAEDSIDALHSIMILRHGRVVAEGWWSPYNADSPHRLFSLSKSFTSTAVGLAVEEGLLSLDDPLIDHFPDVAPPEPSDNLKAMRIRDLLRMNTGHLQADADSFWSFTRNTWAASFLAVPVSLKPGTHFLYNTGGSYMLSATIQQRSGMTILDYLTPRLTGGARPSSSSSSRPPASTGRYRWNGTAATAWWSNPRASGPPSSCRFGTTSSGGFAPSSARRRDASTRPTWRAS